MTFLQHHDAVRAILETPFEPTTSGLHEATVAACKAIAGLNVRQIQAITSMVEAAAKLCRTTTSVAKIRTATEIVEMQCRRAEQAISSILDLS